MARYARIRSWHVVAGVSRASKPLNARCGRPFHLDAETADTLPLGEPSCEVCLRLAAHDEDNAGELDPSGEVPAP